MTTQIERRSVITDEKTAAALIKDGMTVAIGGFITSSHPMPIVRQIIKNGVKNLFLIGAASSGLECDLLIGAGCVRKIMSPYVAAEHFCPIGPFYRVAVERGEVEVWECDEAMYYMALRAAMHQLPFLPWRTGVGTSFPEVNPDLKVFQDPVKGETLIAVPAVKPDIAVIHAAYADPYGNVQHVGTGFGDRAMWRAAEMTIVTCEKVVPYEYIRRDPKATSMHGVQHVVRAPYGAHPYASPGFYVEDGDHIRAYVEAANAYARKGDRGPFEAYLEKYIYGPETHGDYLDVVGAKQLISLYEY